MAPFLSNTTFEVVRKVPISFLPLNPCLQRRQALKGTYLFCRFFIGPLQGEGGEKGEGWEGVVIFLSSLN
jgi:hypothetical protein